MWSGVLAILNEPHSIVITGFMGTGKTTISQMVAERLRRPLVDTDAMITQRAGMSIADIFAQQGEPAFRTLEAEVCAELVGQPGLVIATGGGMLVSSANRTVMLRSAIVMPSDQSFLASGGNGREVLIWRAPQERGLPKLK